MANSLYDSGRQKFLEGSIASLTDVIKVALVKNTYTPNLATHVFLSDIGANTIGTDQTLAGITTTAGVFNANNVTFSSVAGGSTVSYILIYKFVSSAANSPLIGLIDTATGLPLTTNGGDISISWSTGASKVFKL